MKRLYDVKVFDFNNPNINIVNTKEEVVDMFNNDVVPIVKSIKAEDDYTVLPVEKQEVLGVIVDTYLKNGEILAEVVLHFTEDIIGELVNYEVNGEFDDNHDYIIRDIVSIELK